MSICHMFMSAIRVPLLFLLAAHDHIKAFGNVISPLFHRLKRPERGRDAVAGVTCLTWTLQGGEAASPVTGSVWSALMSVGGRRRGRGGASLLGIQSRELGWQLSSEQR